MAKVLMKGNEALGEAAIRAGCVHFFGYPITPQTEVPEYLAKRYPEVGGVFVQAESELASINMIYGAAGVGVKCLTSSSSPGISLMAEGMSYIAACELPCVIINIMRAGPGLGGILPAQSDYSQATKGHGHGDYRLIVLAPCSVQESVDLMILAFELAEKYRNPVMVIADGMIGQMMEPVEFPLEGKGPPMGETDWALTGCEGRERRIVNSLYLSPEKLNELNLKLKRKYDQIRSQRAALRGLQRGWPLRAAAHRLRHHGPDLQDGHRRGEGGRQKRRPLPPHHGGSLPLRAASRGDGPHAARRQGLRRRDEHGPDAGGRASGRRGDTRDRLPRDGRRHRSLAG